MAQTYDITFETASVGTARMEKQGLYYRIVCRCRLPEEGFYRIHAVYGNKRQDLGICVPVDGAFGVDKTIPAKRLGEGIPSFELVIKDWKEPEPVMVQPQEDTHIEEMTQPVEELPAEEKMPEVAYQTEALPDGEAIPDEENTGEDNTESMEERNGIFVPVSGEEPFDYLDRLENAVMEVRDDAVGVVLLEE